MSSTDLNGERVGNGVRVLLRVLVVTVTVYPAFRKFFEYSYRVEQFASYGFPLPELAVPLTGVIEVGAIVMIAAGFAGRLGAAALVVGMVIAIVSAGPNPASVLVLLGSLGLLFLGTGRYSYWDPSLSELIGRDRPVQESSSAGQ